MKRKMSITEARKQFSDLIEQVRFRGDSYIISKRGKPAAAVVPVQVYENWRRQRAAFFDKVRSTQKAVSLSPEEAEVLAMESISTIRSDDVS